MAIHQKQLTITHKKKKKKPYNRAKINTRGGKKIHNTMVFFCIRCIKLPHDSQTRDCKIHFLITSLYRVFRYFQTGGCHILCPPPPPLFQCCGTSRSRQVLQPGVTANRNIEKGGAGGALLYNMATTRQETVKVKCIFHRGLYGLVHTQKRISGGLRTSTPDSVCVFSFFV